MSLEKLVETVERESQRIASSLVEALRRSNKILIFSCGLTWGLAQHLAFSLKLANFDLNILPASGELLHNFVLPYVSESLDLLIVFASRGAENCLLRICNALRLVGVEKSVIVVPKLIPEVRQRLGIEILEIEPRVYRTSVIHANLRIAVAIGGSQPRIARIEDEIPITPQLVEDVGERYKEIAKQLKNREITIVYTESMRSVAEELAERGYRCLDIEMARIAVPQNIVVVHTSIEDQSVNELMLAALRKGVTLRNVARLRLNTDPLTAPLYAHLFLNAVLPYEDSG